MNYSNQLYEVDNTGEAIENRHSFDMIVNKLENDKIKKKQRVLICRPCKVELTTENMKYNFLCNDCFTQQMNEIRGKK